MPDAPLSDQPTVAVSMRCLRCGGNGQAPEKEIREGNTRRLESGGNCSQCNGKGKMEERVTFKQLAELMNNPDDAERQLFGSFAP
jgi:DnaJ-class molecular chaperone